jgi:CSLREA domain-containing protein
VNTTADENNFNGNCSLREAITAANTDAVRDACAAGSGADAITVPAGTYTLSITGANEDAALMGDLDVTGTTDINGAGARETIVQGDTAFDDRIFDNTGTTEISCLTITGGNAGSTADGGGVRNTGGDLTLDEVSVSDNDTAGGGGGIISEGGGLDIINSTVSGNEAGGGIGGVYQESGIANIKNSTISGNRAAGSAGGVAAALNSFMHIRSSTIASNTSSGQGGGIFTTVFSDITVKNSIVSANTTTNCYAETGSAIASLGNNLERADDCGFDQPTDLPITDPMLDPLSDNGGPTDTHALRIGSQAIDAGDSDQSADQRGVTRPQDGDNNASIIEDDIGAFEQAANTAPEITPLSPKPGSRISDRTPRIRATVTDLETDLAVEDITLFVNDNEKDSFSYDTALDELSYVSAKLKDGRKHTVRIEATDGRIISSESWSFRVKNR